jgi:hypothetical protein
MFTPTTPLRDALLSGLRQAENFLSLNRDLPVPSDLRLLIPVSTNNAVREFAVEHLLPDADVRHDRHGNASLDIRFGPLVTYHVYGYRDFAESCERTDAAVAERYATSHGLVLVPGDTTTGRAA